MFHSKDILDSVAVINKKQHFTHENFGVPHSWMIVTYLKSSSGDCLLPQESDV